MKFKKLAEYFQKLESTPSRNLMVEILAELFKEAGQDEIGQIVFLTQGRVAPLYEPVEFGMAEKMVIKAIAKANESDESNVSNEFKKAGDLGQVAQDLSHLRILRDLSVLQVFEKLVEITKAGGEGSVEKKISILSELLKSVDPLSARYVARTPVDKLRLGFSDMTVLEGLSWMIDGTKKHKPIIEAAYNIRPDLGYIGARVKGLGTSGLKNIKPEVGVPILVMRAERLTSPAEIIDEIGNCAVEPKLDGLRTQLHLKKDFIRLYSRGMENVTDMYPDLLAAAKTELSKFDEVILDGEAIGFDPKTGKYLPFQETVQRKRKFDIAVFSKNIPIRYVVFDVLFVDGESLIDKPYSERRKAVERLSGPIIVPVEMEVVEKAEQLEKLFLGNLKKGLEGIMAKKLDGVYQAGARGWNWIKLKGSYLPAGRQVRGILNDTIDCVVMGIDFGQGKRNSFGVGAFLVGVFDAKTNSFKTVSKIGTGLTDQEWSELKIESEKLKIAQKPKNYDVNKIMEPDVWVKPKLVGEFRADELTKSPMHTAGLAMRFPRLVRWREKKPEDTTTVRELRSLKKLR